MFVIGSRFNWARTLVERARKAKGTSIVKGCGEGGGRGAGWGLREDTEGLIKERVLKECGSSKRERAKVKENGEESD